MRLPALALSRVMRPTTLPARGIRYRSLRTRIVGWSFVPTAIILFAVALVTFYAYQQVTEELVVERIQQVTRLSAGQLSAELAEYANTLGSLARTAGLYRGGPVSTGQSLRQASTSLSVFDAGVVALDMRGRVLASEPSRYDILAADWSDRPYYQELLSTRGPVFSDLSLDGPGGAEVVVISVPILNEQGEMKGALLGMFRLGATAVSAFYGDLVKLRAGGEGHAYLVDGNRRLLFHPDPTRVGSDFSGEAPVEEALAGNPGAQRLNDVQGRDVVAGYAPVPGTRWGLVSEEEWSALQETGEGYRNFLLVLLALGLAVPTLVVIVGVKRLTQPIVELTAAAERVAGGDFAHSIRVPTGDELEELAVQFNRMAAQLRESYGELERRVQDRTRELATLNAISLVTSRSLEIQPILQAALDTTMEAMSMESGAAYRLDPSGERFVMVVSHGVSVGVESSLAEVRLERWAHAMEGATQVPFVRYLDQGPRDRLGELLVAEGYSLVVDVPLISKGRLIGLVGLASRTARRLSPEELSLLASIAAQIGVALDNARLYEEAEQSAAAAERSRLARDLHDAVSQTLFSTTLIADVLPKLWERKPEEARKRLEELRQLTRGALAEMRTLLLELRPAALLEADIRDLLRQLAESLTGRARIPVELKVEGERELSADVKVTFYRVAQEALNNVAKHSGALSASLSLCLAEDQVELRVADDGHGFDLEAPRPDRLGLGIMRERAEAVGGRLELVSAPGEGTEVRLTWSPSPVERPAVRDQGQSLAR